MVLEGAQDDAVVDGHTTPTPAPRFARAVALSDNLHALSGSADGTVKLFNVNDGAVLRNFTHHTKTVECLALLPDGLRFVSGSNEGTARIVEIGRLC